MRRKSRKVISFLGALLIATLSISDGGSFAVVDLTAGNENSVLAEETETFTQAHIPKDRIQYVPQSQPQGIQVEAYADQDVLPEGVTLKVEMNEENSAEYQEAERELDRHAVEYDGFMALDIGFYDEQGNEIEPEEGTVEVKIELDSNLLPEEIEYESLEIQHHEKTDKGIKVETVANASEEMQSGITGEVKIENEIVKAEFTVTSFSRFTISWTGGNHVQGVTVHYVDQGGNAISGTQTSSVRLNHGVIVTLGATYAGEISGYRYQGARLNSRTGIEIQRLRRDVVLQYSTSTSGDQWWQLANLSDIYLVYEKEDIEPPLEQSREATHEKYVTKKADGTYDLSLTISGAVGSMYEETKLDVIYVLDISRSMEWNMHNDNGTNNARRNAAAKAISDFSTSIKGRKDIDSQFALVTFSGLLGNIWGNDANVRVNWTGDPAQIINTSKNVSPSGGTNYQAGLREAKSLISRARSDAAKAVIFISDGDPTLYYNNYGITDGNGLNYDKDALSAGKNEAASLKTNYFFTVGVGIAQNYSKLRELNLVVSTDLPFEPNGSVTNNYFAGTDETSLKQAFDTILENVTNVLCTDVTITDTLSENVYLTNPKQLVISVINEKGEEVEKGENTLLFEGATIQANYDSDKREVSLVFPDGYELKNGYTYKITVNIDATETAYEKYRNTGNQYINTGEKGTGVTSESQSGFYTNDRATVTYRYNGEEVTSTYPRPVIQLNPGTLVIRKKIEGLGSPEIESLKESLKFAYELESTRFTYDGENIKSINNNVLLESFQPPEEGDEYYTYTIEGLSPGTSYTVSEEDAEIEGYTLETKVMDSPEIIAVGTISSGEPKSEETFINTYIQNTVDLEVLKKNKTNDILEGATFKLESTNLVEPIISKGVDGKFVFERLPAGTYILTEIKAPNNYVLLADSITIIITKKGDVTIDEEAYLVEAGIVKLDVINYEIYELPSAGGIGTYLFTISGVAIATTAILLFINEQRRGAAVTTGSKNIRKTQS